MAMAKIIVVVSQQVFTQTNPKKEPSKQKVNATLAFSLIMIIWLQEFGCKQK